MHWWDDTMCATFKWSCCGNLQLLLLWHKCYKMPIAANVCLTGSEACNWLQVCIQVTCEPIVADTTCSATTFVQCFIKSNVAYLKHCCISCASHTKILAQQTAWHLAPTTTELLHLYIYFIRHAVTMLHPRKTQGAHVYPISYHTLQTLAWLSLMACSCSTSQQTAWQISHSHRQAALKHQCLALWPRMMHGQQWTQGDGARVTANHLLSCHMICGWD